jgi:sugar transferase EpsL
MKRAIDIFLAVVLFIAFLPAFIVIPIIILIKDGGPVLFKQKRPGLNAVPFEIYKFQTMKVLYSKDGNLLPDSDRLTKLGKLLRRYSLDELPQLLNVIKGDLSFVGPRPLLMEYLPLYTKEQTRRHEVMPGITGWAQINGRNNLLWEEKFKLDVWYVENTNVILDLKILFITIIRVFSGKGISQDGHATMENFRGSQEL